ncbi:hypothetical protein AYI69_g11122 [Smittium culicis]|uniref:Uncharacterized protein n=1 Tax=Smittium culicis TaxID=133412 RepID=A0A1R1X106_9FUNG|nr:hypothetical protein AYI69_g11122 [Smittium culicis]
MRLPSACTYTAPSRLPDAPTTARIMTTDLAESAGLIVLARWCAFNADKGEVSLNLFAQDAVVVHIDLRKAHEHDAAIRGFAGSGKLVCQHAHKQKRPVRLVRVRNQHHRPGIGHFRCEPNCRRKSLIHHFPLLFSLLLILFIVPPSPF